MHSRRGPGCNPRDKNEVGTGGVLGSHRRQTQIRPNVRLEQGCRNQVKVVRPLTVMSLTHVRLQKEREEREDPRKRLRVLVVGRGKR